MSCYQAFNYHSEQVHSTNGKTRKNIVNVDNGRGTKSVEQYDSKGKLLQKSKKKLTASQIRNIKNNVFIPGLFKDCMRSKTRRVNRRRN
jgi:hypothetical protein